jgi:hypothetical protein
VSLDWGAVSGALGWVGIGLTVVGLIAQAAVGASLRKRPHAALVGAGVLGVGLLLLDAAKDSLVGVLGQLAAATLLAPVFFWQNRLTKVLAAGSAILATGVYLYGRSAQGELSQALWTLGAVWGALVAFIIFFWLREKLQSPKTPRDAHA